MSFDERIKSLSEMKDNWDGRYSSAPSKEAISTAGAVCPVPLGSGGVQLSMYAGGAEVEIEIDLTGRVVSVCWTKASGVR